MPRVGTDTTRKADFERSFEQLRDYALRVYNSIWHQPNDWTDAVPGSSGAVLTTSPQGLLRWELATGGGGDQIVSSFFVRDHWARGGPLSILIGYSIQSGTTADFTVTLNEINIGALESTATSQVLVAAETGLPALTLLVFEDKDTFVLDGNEGVFTLTLQNTNSNQINFYGSIMGFQETEQR